MRKLVVAILLYILRKLGVSYDVVRNYNEDCSTDKKHRYPTGVIHVRRYKGCKVMYVRDYEWRDFDTQTAAAKYLTERSGVLIHPYTISNAINRDKSCIYHDGVLLAQVKPLDKSV